MTETQGPTTTADQQSTNEESTGVNREHLRNYEQLRRSVVDRKVAGVAGGLGRHLNIDPTILRVLFVVLCFFGGAGFVLYGAAWLLVPEDGRTDAAITTSPNTRNALLIGAGVIAALLLVGDSVGGVGFPWPILIVGVGVLLYLAFRDQGERPSATPPPGYYGPPPATEAGRPDPTYAGAAPTYAEQPPAPPWTPTTQNAAGYPPQPRPYRGPKLFGFTLALLAIALGSLGLYDVSGGAVSDSAYAALALTVVGLMLVVGAFVGRAGGLIFLGLVSAFALMVSSVAGSFDAVNWQDGDRVRVAPTSASNVRPVYSVEAGQVYVDLSRVTDSAALDGRTIDVGGNAGEVVLVLPEGVRSEVVADIDGPGQVDLPDRNSGGIDTHLEGDYGSGDATVTFTTHLSIGHIDVRNP
jgi:phage shock protein PspC (stress-responsive transcriptional regulator)